MAFVRHQRTSIGNSLTHLEAAAAWMLLLAVVVEPARAEVITLSCEFVPTSQPAVLGNEKLVDQIIVDDQEPSIVLRQVRSRY